MTQELTFIGISGKMCSGKDTAAQYLIERYGGFRMAFADELKRIAAHLFRVDPVQKDDHTREVLQRMGVAMRDIDENVWVNALIREAKDVAEWYGHKYCYVPDVRFPNEVQGIVNNYGSVIRLDPSESVRQARVFTLYPDMDPKRLNHVSETALDTYSGWFDMRIKTDTMGFMRNDLDYYMRHIIRAKPVYRLELSSL